MHFQPELPFSDNLVFLQPPLQFCTLNSLKLDVYCVSVVTDPEREKDKRDFNQQTAPLFQCGREESDTDPCNVHTHGSAHA